MIALWLLAGSVVGAANGMMRWWTVLRIGGEMGHNPLPLVWGGFLLRIALVAALLSLGLSRGIIAGLVAFAGLWLARWATTIWFGALRGLAEQSLTAPSAD